MLPAGYRTLFVAELPLGSALGVSLPAPGSPQMAAAFAKLPAAEQMVVQKVADRRRGTFTGGRWALRGLLAHKGHADVAEAIVSDDRGAPVLPPSLGDLAASISHKDDVAVAFLARAGASWAGIDLEERAEKPEGIQKHILTEEERDRLGELDDVSAADEVLLRFSAKEALYKVLDPTMRRYIGFHEVEVEPRAGGELELFLRLKEGVPPPTIELAWTTAEALGVAGQRFFLCTAVAR